MTKTKDGVKQKKMKKDCKRQTTAKVKARKKEWKSDKYIQLQKFMKEIDGNELIIRI